MPLLEGVSRQRTRGRYEQYPTTVKLKTTRNRQARATTTNELWPSLELNLHIRWARFFKGCCCCAVVSTRTPDGLQTITRCCMYEYVDRNVCSGQPALQRLATVCTVSYCMYMGLFTARVLWERGTGHIFQSQPTLPRRFVLRDASERWRQQ